MDVELNTAYDVLFNLYRQGFEIILSTRSLVRPGLSTQALSLEQMERTLFAHMLDESEKSSDQQILRQFLQSHQEYLENKMEQVARTNSDIIRDVRVLENVVANLLNRWPLRIMRAFKGFFKKKRD
ncbi:MAG: hypothetical protein HQ583_06030 [Candidatus Abyssubacteria bacterium]|nr:hypothetical protein [Candidatus Abyssubacteria bacterium]